MKNQLRRAAVILLAASISLSPMAGAPPRDRGGHDRDFSKEIVRIIKRVQKLLGISSNDDLPLPPPPHP